MTVQMYTDGEGLAPLVNVGTAANSVLSVNGMEAVLKLGVTKGDGKRWSTQDVPFSIVNKTNSKGGSEEPTLAGLIEAVVYYAGKMSRMSDGVGMGLFLKLGKYRDDEKPKNIGTKDKAYGVVHLTNVPESTPCEPIDPDELPVKQINNRVYLPWLNSSISDQDLVQNLGGSFTATADGVEYSLGRIRFSDTDKSAMEASATPIAYGADVKRRKPNQAPILPTNDVSDGIEDFVFGEQYVGLTDGQDDGETIEPPSLN